MTDRRDEFLVAMYNQMFNNINRHITVTWQSAGLVVGSFALFSLVEKQVISLDIASSIVIMLCGCMYLHLIDASWWYNRNIIIITNIEKEFLRREDLKYIHYYFNKHKSNKAIGTIGVNKGLCAIIATLIAIYHFESNVYPGFSSPIENVQLLRALPYATAFGFMIWIRKSSTSINKSYNALVNNSPGHNIETLP